MAHVELSLSQAFVPSAGPSTPQETDNFQRWSNAVASALEPCLLIDLHTNIEAVSVSCCELLGLGTPAKAVGRPLLKGELRLLDFTAARAELPEQETEKIPPLLALSSGRLARGLLRVRSTAAGGSDATVDAIATPVITNGVVAGSLTFFSQV